MLHNDCCEDPTTDIKSSSEPHKFRFGQFREIIQNFIGDGFMKCSFVSERYGVELEAFELHTFFIRQVV